MKSLLNKVLVASFVGFIALTNVQAMDAFDFGDDVAAVMGFTEHRATAEAVVAAQATVDARAIARALQTLANVANDHADCAPALETLVSFMAANFAALNLALGEALANHRDIIENSAFKVLKEAATGATVIHTKIKEVTGAWQVILQATIKRSLLVAASTALVTHVETVAALRARLDAKASALAEAQEAADRSRVQALQAARGQQAMATELTGRLALLDAGTAGLRDAARTAGESVKSAR